MTNILLNFIIQGRMPSGDPPSFGGTAAAFRLTRVTLLKQVERELQKQPNQELKPYHHFLLRTPKINGIEIGHTTADYFQRHFAKGPSALPRSYFYPEHPTFAGPMPYHALFFIVDDLIKVAESVVKIVEQ